MSLLTREKNPAIPLLAFAVLGVAIWLFQGPTIDLGPRHTPIEETQTKPDPGPGEGNKPQGQPVPATGSSGRGPRIPNCNGIARVETTGKTTGGAPIYRLLDTKGRVVGYAHRDAKWQSHPRSDPNCEIFEFYTAKGSPLMEADCNCNDTGRSVAGHKPINL